KMDDVNAPPGQAPAMALPVCTDDQIFPRISNNQPFVAPPSSDVPINFINELGYPKLVRNVSNVVTNDMFQPWRALITIINLCLTGKTSRFERPRAPVMQILWGIVKRAHIDYAERIWEEFTQSIHTFIEVKRKLSRHTTGKKKATLIVIPSIRFTKLIIHHLQRRHKFNPRPDSSLHLPNEEHVLGYLKFSANDTKREVFGMPIPGNLITSDIQEASYYQEYLENVAKHRRYLAGETRSDQDSPAPKPTKPARKPKTTTPKAPPRPSVLTPVTLAQPAPTSAPAKPQEKKCKQATETSDKPPKAKKSKYSFIRKKRSLKSALEESMKTMYAAAPRGPLPPVVIRKPESGKYQPLLEVPGKGKAKVTKEQVSHDLQSLQKPKKKSPADQYIFQRRIFEPTKSSGHDESPYALLGQSDSKGASEKVVLGANEGGQDKGQARPDPGAQAEGQTGSDAGAQDEGQARSNPDENSKGQAGPDPGNTGADELSMPSHVVHAGSDHEHMDIDVADVSPQPSTEQLDKGFTATAYPKVQENLKLTVKEHVLLEEHASSSGTLYSLQHLSKDISFGDMFFSDKPSEADNDKANAETKVESMVTVTIQQDMSSISLMISPIIDLTSRPESPKVHQKFKATITDTTTTTTLPPPPAQQQSTIEAMMIKRIGELKHIMANLIQVNKEMEERLDKHGAMQAPLRNRFRDLPEADMKEILHQRMWKTESYKSHEDHMQLFEALEKSINHDHSEELGQDLAEARKKKKKSRESPKTPPGSPPHQPPPPPPPAGPSEASGAPGASVSSQVQTPPPPSSSTNQENLEMDEDMGPDEQAQSSYDEDIGSAHIPKVNLRQDWWKPLEEERPATPKPAWSIPSSDTGDIATFMDWFCKRRGITELKPQDLEAPAFEIVKTQLNLTKPQWDATGFEYKHDYTVINSPKDVMFRDKYGVQMMMRFTEIHKFSDGTLQQIDEALDYRVKEFRINRINPGLNTRFWTRKDVDRSKAFMFAIQKRLKTRRIFRNLESFVGRRVREGDYRLLKLDIEKATVCSSLRSLKPKCTIESKAKRSSKIISLGHYSIMLASSHTVKSKTDIKSPTHYPCANELMNSFEKPFEVLNNVFEHWVFNSLVYSLCALSALRRFGLRMASTTAEPYQGDSLEFYLITGRIPTVAAAGQRDVNSQLHAHILKSLSMTQ
nr:monodehydroascorbate reductase [Tanacetum cinerariifolium]